MIYSCHYWHFGAGDSFLWEIVLYIVAYIVTSVASVYKMPKPAPLIMTLKMSPLIVKCPLVENHNFSESFGQNYWLRYI